TTSIYTLSLHDALPIFATMSHACINAAAVGIKAADDHVVEADKCSEHAHRRDQPKRCISGDGKSQANHIGLTRPPIAVQNRRRRSEEHTSELQSLAYLV